MEMNYIFKSSLKRKQERRREHTGKIQDRIVQFFVEKRPYIQNVHFYIMCLKDTYRVFSESCVRAAFAGSVIKSGAEMREI